MTEALLPLKQLDRDILKLSINHARTLSPTWFLVCEVLDNLMPLLYGEASPVVVEPAPAADLKAKVKVEGGNHSQEEIGKRWICTACKHAIAAVKKPRECGVCGGNEFRKSYRG